MIWILALLAHGEILVDGAPQVDSEVTVTVVDDLSRPISGATVRAVHRQGLYGEQDLAVGLTDARGRVYWTPEQGGPVVLRSREQERIVHVARDAAPASTLVLLGLLTALGIGAGLVGFWPGRRRA